MSDDEWIDLVASTVDHPRGLLLVADQAGDAVGLTFARVSEDGITTHVGAMWVEPDARGGGVGRELLGEALSWGRSLGSTRAELWVTVGNSRAERFYAAAGFAPTGKTDVLREGSHLKVIALSLDL
jgi:GNAT superfamily N-acetyltransferase